MSCSEFVLEERCKMSKGQTSGLNTQSLGIAAIKPEFAMNGSRIQVGVPGCYCLLPASIPRPYHASILWETLETTRKQLQ